VVPFLVPYREPFPVPCQGLLVVEGRRVLPAVHASLARVVAGQNLRREVEVLGSPLGPEGAEIDRVDRVEAAPEDPVHQRHQLPAEPLVGWACAILFLAALRRVFRRGPGRGSSSCFANDLP